MLQKPDSYTHNPVHSLTKDMNVDRRTPTREHMEIDEKTEGERETW